MLYSLTKEELRSLCKNSIETFEVWARRIIHEKLSSKYGEQYFDVTIENDEKILNKEHYKLYDNVKQANPSRCHRPVDALFIETLVYVLCKEILYRKLFKEVLDYSYPQGCNQVRWFLNKIQEPRNPLSHANPISMRQAEQIVCYTNDFVDAVKQYYKNKGEDKMWNVPQFVKISDSLGNEFYPRESTDLPEFFHTNHNFYVGESYTIWFEVDSSFSDKEYAIKVGHGINMQTIQSNTKKFTKTFTDSDVANLAFIQCQR